MGVRYSIIIPTKNEEEGIAKVICSIPREIRKYSEIIVPDSSDDLTPIIAKGLGAKVLKVKRGKGRAMKMAVERSRGDTLVFLDADGTDPPQYIPKLLKKLENNNLVLGCRSGKPFKEDDRVMRDLFKIYCRMISPIFMLVGFNVHDPSAGFRAIRKKDWNRLNLKSNGMDIEAEMNINALKEGFKVGEVLIPHFKRVGGLAKSKVIFHPKNWIRMLNPLVKYIKDEKIKRKFRKLELNLSKN
jgi:glycosyltransferase involved in cell wall biosynthesis